MKRLLYIVIIVISLSLAMTPGVLNAQPNGTYDRALYLYKEGKFQEAVDVLKDYLQRRPEPAAYYLMGYALYELGRYEEAMKYFDEAYLVDPEFKPEKIDFKRAKP
ncbi:MAG: tetratricopeptide repeat protein [Nitrospirae bacterium]|nr:tetratricopeptide repeat protein [Nitrospirota bacterium]